jgi:hypothetical protein
MFEVFRMKNHDFTLKNHIISNFRGARAGCPPPPPLLDPPLGTCTSIKSGGAIIAVWAQSYPLSEII